MRDYSQKLKLNDRNFHEQIITFGKKYYREKNMKNQYKQKILKLEGKVPEPRCFANL